MSNPFVCLCNKIATVKVKKGQVGSNFAAAKKNGQVSSNSKKGQVSSNFTEAKKNGQVSSNNKSKKRSIWLQFCCSKNGQVSSNSKIRKQSSWQQFCCSKKTFKLAATVQVKHGQVGSNFAAAKNGQVSSNSKKKPVKLAAILLRQKTVKSTRRFFAAAISLLTFPTSHS